MKEIPLTQGKVALVDDADYEYLKLFKWYAKESDKSWYAVRKEKINRRSVRGCKAKRKDERKTIRMHSVIMDCPNGMTGHHKDGDGLNNQRYNLKRCTLMENAQEATKKREEKREEIPF